MEKAVEISKKKDIKASDYLRFCCLVDFFQINVHELCMKYSELYYDDEDCVTDEVLKYFRYDMQRYKSNGTALIKWGEALTELLWDKDNAFYSHKIITRAKQDLLDESVLNIVNDYEKFCSFFDSIIETTQMTQQDEIMRISDYEDVDSIEMRNFFRTLHFLSQEGIIFDTIIVNEIFEKRFVLNIERLQIKHILSAFVYNRSEEERIKLANDWKGIYPNWDILVRIIEIEKLQKYFSKILSMEKKGVCEELKEMQKITSNSSFTKTADDLIYAAIRFSYILQYECKRPRIQNSKIWKWLDTLADDNRQYNCYVFCQEHLKEINELTSEHMELLFYYACTYSEKR